MIARLDRDEDERRGIQSVEIGLSVITALQAASGPLSLKSLAVSAGLPVSNCHRYCVSFVRAGYMIQDARTGRYDLGPRLIAAGLVALERADPVSAGALALEDLVDATGYTGQLAVWSERGPTIVRWITGRMAVRTSLTLGATLPLLTSATGRVFLAFLPERQTAAVLAQEEGDGIDVAALVSRTRKLGVGRVSGSHIPGLSAAAAPVLDAFGEAAAVMTLVGTRNGIDDDAIKQLRATATGASAALGHCAAA